MIDRLSQMLSVRALERDDGTITVLAGDTVVVDGAQAYALEVRLAAGGGFEVARVGGGVVDPGAGSLRALVDLTTTRLPAIRSRLDTFAAAVVNEVNAIHRLGFTPGGATGTDFFDPAGGTAGTMALAAPIAASATNIAAGATNAPGDGAIALQIAGLAGAGVASLAGKSLREFYVEITAGVGLDVQHAIEDADTQAALVDYADQQRSSVSGVSVEEEMVTLIAQQQAYSAAARLIRVADEMMQDLMNTI
jgi:flagellar hook-associated protein 1 FlgK